MENGRRPHSRKKTVGSGSANVGKGRKVNTGSRPVGVGGYSEGSSGGRDYSSNQQRAFPLGKLNLKTILILIGLVIIVGFVLKTCAGSGLSSMLGSSGGGLDISSDENNNYYSDTDTFSANTGLDTSVSKLARQKYYTPVGNGQDTVTIMVYMCGTDLESKYGMATKDINEMLNARFSDKVNLIVETGGCSKWQNNTISNTYNQIYKVESRSMKLLEDNFGNASMTDPDNLTKFIKYCKKYYPADRNILIFWDHGGGSISGYGYDEKNKTSSSMTLSKINSALKNGGCTFDFIGFDACLMATLETDLVCNNYADYLIGSEESEPGTGWYYTNWLTMLSEDTSTPTVYIGQKIVDDFVKSCCSASPNAQVTLSVVDLSELDGTVPDALSDFASSTNKLVTSDDYKLVSDARAGARQFSQKNKLNQIDIIDLAQRIGTNEANNLAKVLQSCVKYNQSTISRSNGISMYFPYENTKTVKNAIASLNDIGEDDKYDDCMDEYTKCIKSFASLEYGGQIAASASQSSGLGDLLGSLGGSSSTTQSAGNSGLGGLLGSILSPSEPEPPQTSQSSGLGGLLGSLITSSSTQSSSTSPVSVLSGLFSGGGSSSSSSAGQGMDASTIINLLGAFSGRSMPTEYDWVDTELIADNAENIAQEFIDPARITATQKNGRKVLELTDDEWNLIQTVELNVFVDDGDGYIDMGLDNTFDWLDNDSLLLEYDGTWLTLNGNASAYYLVSDTEQSDGSWVTVGRIPALLNDQFVNLQVVFDDDNPEGVITGAYPMYDNSGIDVQAKGDIKVSAGDKIELLCDYYDLDGNYSASYSLGNSFTVPNSGLKLTNLKLNVNNVRVTYRLTDIYGNHFWVAAD